MSQDKIALVVGATGIAGGNLAALLIEKGWTKFTRFANSSLIR